MIYNYIKRLFFLLTCTSIVMLSACKDKWADHNALLNADNSVTLLDKIKQQPELSSFADLLARTGYDEILASSKTFTVWAPNNEAIKKADQRIFEVDSLTRQFVANHIVNQNYLVATLKSSGLAALRIQALSGKYISLKVDGVDEAKTLKADIVVKNGVFNEVDAALEVHQNVWEYINGLTGVGQKQMNYIRSLKYSVVNGAKIYGTTGTSNEYLEKVAQLNDERRRFTYILLTDEAFDHEYNKLSKFFNTPKTQPYDSTTTYRTSWNVVKDFVADTIITQDKLAAVLLSNTAVNIPIDKNAIVSSYRASNGMVYVMNKVDFNIFQDKIRPIILEGESFSSYSQSDKSANIFTRIRKDADGLQFTDKFISGTTVAQFWMSRRVDNLYAAKYQVYWRALNDQAWSAATATAPSAPVNFLQKIGIASAPGSALPYIDLIGYKTVAFNDPADLVRPKEQFKEVYLGEVTIGNWIGTRLYIINDNNRTTGLNTISLDYLKLVPIN